MKKTTKPSGTRVSPIPTSKAARRRTAPPKPRAAQNRLSGIIENTQAGYFFIDRKGIFRDVNKAWLAMHGYDSPAEVLGKHFSLTQADTDLDAANRMVSEILKGQPVPTGEFSRRRKDGSVGYHTFSASPVISGGKVTGIEGFLIDITEQKKLTEHLRRERDRLQRYMNTVETLIVGLDDKGCVTEINPAGCRLLGWSREELVGRSWFTACLPQPEGMEKVYPVFKKLMAGDVDHTEYFENAVITRSGEIRYIDWHNTVCHDERGKITGTLSSGDDITERRQIEQKVQESEKRYRTVADFTYDWEYWIDPDGTFDYVSPSCERITGWKREEFEAHPERIITMIHPDDRPAVEPHLRTPNAGAPCLLTYRIITKQGEERWIGHQCQPVYDADGRFIGRRASNRDITDRKRIDEELLRSKTFLEQSFEQSPIPMVLVEMPGAILKIVNSAYRTFMGIHDEPPRIGQSFFDIHLSFRYFRTDGTPVDSRELPMARAIAGERTDGEEFRIVRKDQGEAWVLASASPIVNARGGIIAAYLTLTDITERRRAQAALQTSEGKYRLLFDKMLDGFALHEIICDDGGRPVDYRFLAINPAFERLTGLKAEDIIGRRVMEALPGTDRHWIEIYGKVALTGEPTIFENYHSQLQKHFEVTAFQSAPNQFACIFADITERKNAQGALKKERDLLSSIAETSPVGITLVDREGKIIFANPQAETILGLSRNDITTLSYNSPAWRIAAEDLTPFPESELPFNRVMAAGKAVFGVRHAIVWPDGKTVFLSINAAPVFGTEGKVEGIVACLEDITARKKAEEDLRSSEAKYRALIEGLPDFIMRFDHEGRHLFVSENVDGWAGLKAAQFIGKTHRELGFPDKLCAFWEAAIFRVFETGMPLETEFTYEGPKRSTVYNWRLIPELDDDWKVRSVLSISRDISERARAEAAIRESEEKFSVAFQNAPVLFAITDIETGVYVDINDETLRVTGFQRAEILGRQAVDIGWLSPGDRDRLMHELATNKRIAPTEINFRSKDGRTVIGQISGDIIRIGGRNYLLTVTVDVTARRAAEEALKESEEKFSLAFRKAPMLMVISSLEDGKIIDINEEVTRLSGYTRDEAIGKTTTQLGWIRPPERERLVDRLIRTGRVEAEELEAIAKDGSRIDCMAYRETLTIGGRPCLLTLAQDIAQRKKAEQEINRVYQLNKSIIASVAEGIIIYDRQFRYRMWNPFMEKLTGIPEADLLGKRIGEYHTPLQHYELEDVLQRVLDGETLHFPPFPYDIPYNNRQGWAEASCMQQRDEKNSVIGVIVSIRDVTEKQHIQERLHRAEKMEALGLLAGGVAHDLNNVLGISLGYSEMLLDDIDPASPLKAHVNNIMKATEKATAIVQDLLTMARRGVAVSRVCNLNTVTTDLLRSAELAALLARHPHVEIQTSLAPDLLNISGSPVHLTKTVMNLIINAAEAIPDHGTITVATQNIHLDHPVKGYDSFTEGDYTVLRVSDTGEGIPAESLPRIFEPFYTKKVMGRSGTGLGLAVVWGTVKDHQGYIDVASNPGQGTIFSLYFPVVRENISAESAAPERSAYVGKGETILVVDDNEQQRELAITMLNKLNYQVAAVASGEDAVDFVKRTPVDLVVLDMIMDPGIDGLETYRRLLAVRPGQKAIIVSGFAETDLVTEAQRLGAGAYVKKPYILENLGTAVRQALEKK